MTPSHSPSPGTPGEGRGEGSPNETQNPKSKIQEDPHPTPLPAYREKEQNADDDDLPRPGKVWDSSGPSLTELLKQHAGEPVSEPVPDSLGEPASAGGEPSQPQEPPNITATDLPNTWQRLLDVLSKKGPGIPSILSHGELKSIGDDNVVIQFSSPTFAAMLDRNGKKDVIRDELSTLLARPVGVAIEVSEEIESAPAAVAPRPTPAPSPKPAFRPTAPVMQSVPVSTGLRLTSELKEALREKNPLIAAVMTELGGEIVRVE